MGWEYEGHPVRIGKIAGPVYVEAFLRELEDNHIIMRVERFVSEDMPSTDESFIRKQ